MHLTQLGRPLQRIAASGCRPYALSPSATTSLTERFAQFRLDAANGVAPGSRRYASVKSQGAYRVTSKKTIPKKMGAKKTGDQYVIPGNILYKQRGTIWHPGENAIMGRDHTIHAAAAGYVKYYRDPLRHPKRQYIGVVFNRDDKLPYPVGAPRKRKLGLVAVPRKPEEVEEEATGPSGIPLRVVRHAEVEMPAAAAAATEGTATTAPRDLPAASSTQTSGEGAKTTPTDANSVIAELIKEKLRSRAEYEAKQEKLKALQQQESQVRRGTRVLRLQSNYSYRETNWEIGRLVGPVGSVAGTEKVGSRKGKMRARRRTRNVFFKGIKQRALAKTMRREEYRRHVREKRARKAVERVEAAAKEKAKIKKLAAAAAAGKDKVEA